MDQIASVSEIETEKVQIGFYNKFPTWFYPQSPKGEENPNMAKLIDGGSDELIARYKSY